MSFWNIELFLNKDKAIPIIEIALGTLFLIKRGLVLYIYA
jgi:hypothetical protein